MEVAILTAVRPFREADLDAVLALREAVFPALDRSRRDRERRRWRWQFDENPCRPAGVPRTFVLEEEGRVAGNFGMVPLRMKIGDRTGLALDGIDLVVDPRLRGRGLARGLADAFMDEALADFPFVAAPTDATSHLVVARGGIVVGAERDPITFVRHRQSGETPPSRPAVVKEVARFDERADRLWDEIAPSFPLIVVRDRAYLDWRYADYPFARCRLFVNEGAGGSLRGVAVVQEDRALDRVYLLDLLFPPGDDEAADALLAAALGIAIESGLALFAAVTREPSVRAALARFGFQPLGQPIPTYIGRLPRSAPPGVTIADWYLSLGDGDALFGVDAP